MSDSPSEPAAELHPALQIQSPPDTLPGILRRLGPGLIIAGSIVGSGELIATTKTGAEAGFVLLWLILLGCVIKVFAQIEFGRFAILNARTTIAGLNDVPGPRLGVNWIVWYWGLMFLVTMGQMGGIVGGVGQSLAISFPITGDFRQQLDEAAAAKASAAQQPAQPAVRSAESGVAPGSAVPPLVASAAPSSAGSRATKDDVLWSVAVTVATSALLVIGRYGLIQHVSTVLVAAFTAVTMFCLFAQQMQPEWAVHWEDILSGLKLRLPERIGSAVPLATALATFGIIGVGANELLAYPYWCLEKGYAAFVGPRDDSAAWVDRARGWMRVMRWDAWCSMAIYTFATLGFYLLGAGVLHRMGLNPAGNEMIRTLATMYVPTFGAWAETVFLVGAFAVLYSTFFVAIACHARVAADVLRVSRLGAHTPAAMGWWIRLLSGLLPFVCLATYLINKDPVTLVLLGGLAQAVMLPMLGLAAVYFRYWRSDPRLAPTRLWDVCLWVSFAGLTITGVWSAVANAEKLKALVAAIWGA